MYLARFPATRACTVTSFVTIAPAAIIATSPTIMLGQRIAFAVIHTFLIMISLCLSTQNLQQSFLQLY